LNNPRENEAEKASAMRYLGYSFHNMSEYDSAINLYKKLLQQDPADNNILLNLSKAYISKGTNLYYDNKFAKAIMAFNTAKEYDEQNNVTIPDYLRLSNNNLLNFSQSRRIIEDGINEGAFKRESIYFIQAEDLAIDFNKPNVSQDTLRLIANEIFYNLDNDIEINPEHSEAYFRYGNINTGLGNVRKSIKYLEKGISYDSDNIDCRLDLTEVYIINNMPLKAIELNSEYKFSGIKRNSALLTYLNIVAKIIVDEDYSSEENRLEKLLEEVIISNWTFDPFNDWLADADLGDEKKNKIRNLTERMEEASQ
jgi:tetratricopeptide (TPR) repeat protein